MWEMGDMWEMGGWRDRQTDTGLYSNNLRIVQLFPKIAIPLPKYYQILPYHSSFFFLS